MLVAEGLPLKEHAVSIVATGRSKTSCAKVGNDFSLVSVYGQKSVGIWDSLSITQIASYLKRRIVSMARLVGLDWAEGLVK